VFKFGESRLDPTLESCLNLQANHNEGFAQRLTDVEFILAEVTVRQEEERDGRLNERCVTYYYFDKSFIYFYLMKRVFYDVTDGMNSGV
jgi:hypothetical protein